MSIRIAYLAAALAMGGALVSSCGPTSVSASATIRPARLIWIGPGVWVVEDYPVAVYYAGGVYWMQRDGFWYRSDYFADGFVRVNVAIVPPLVIRVHRPHLYVRYRAARGVPVRVIEHRRTGHRRRVYRR